MNGMQRTTTTTNTSQPGAKNGMQRTTATTSQPGAKLIDDFLRRELRVGDPRSPTEVVTALRRRYATEAARIDQEAAGLPIRYDQPVMVATAVAIADTPGTKEERRVRGDLESDLAGLIESRDNREWAPEIRGWRDALLRECADGAAAARFAQDPAMRDRGFLAVRKLGEFARVARLVGVMNLPLNGDYRRLASTLDDAANVIRILMGEALYNAGLQNGGIIIQVPLVDLRQRRDSLVVAVRRLSGLSEETFDGDWGDDIVAYRALLEELDRRSLPELKVYLREELLAPVLDNLVSSVARQDPEGLRHLAATAPVEIARLSRLREIISVLGTGTPGVPALQAAALSTFEQSLRLFLDAFTQTRSGARLIDLAVPLPMAAQQSDSSDREGRRILRDLVGGRGELAIEAECFLSSCGCGLDELRCQVKLDKVLYDVDRAIDLIAQGQGRGDAWGNEERRASIYGIIARNMRDGERGCVTPETVYPLVSDITGAGLALVAAAAATAQHEGANPAAVNVEIGAYAQAIEPLIRRLVTAADVLAAGRPLSEGLLRDLQQPQPPVTPGIAALPNINDQRRRFTRLVTTLTSLPVAPGGVPAMPGGARSALAIALDAAELVAGASGIGAPGVAGVIPGAGAAPAEIVGAGVGATLFNAIANRPPILAAALNAIVAARGALIAALVALGAQTRVNLNLAAAAARDAGDHADVAHSIAFPVPGLAALPGLQQRALMEAEDAARAAADVAQAVAELPELPLGRQGEPTGLWEALDQIHAALLGAGSPLPADPVEQGRLMREVFEDQLRAEQDWIGLINSLAPRCLGPGRRDIAMAARELLYGNPHYDKIRRLRDIPVQSPPPPVRVSVGALLSSAAVTVPPQPPAGPTLTSLSPSSATASGTALTLAVNGSGFAPGASIRWNGQTRSTVFVSTVQVTASITAGDIAVPGTASVTVVNPGSGSSNALPFRIDPAPPSPPTLTHLAPPGRQAGGAGFPLTVSGSGFVSGATVRWNGQTRSTTFVSAAQLTADISAGDIASPGTADVTVLNPGNVSSNVLPFRIDPTSPPPPALSADVRSRLLALLCSAYENISDIQSHTSPASEWNKTVEMLSTAGYTVHAKCDAKQPPGSLWSDLRPFIERWQADVARTIAALLQDVDIGLSSDAQHHILAERQRFFHFLHELVRIASS
jgi:IPT/TIG domain